MSRQEVVYLNGIYSPKEEATLSILDRGFLFGDGVYELIPIYQHLSTFLKILTG